MEFLSNLVVLHGGTSPVLSQTVLTLMFVVLGITLVGMGFGYLTKTKENLRQHRWMLTAAVALTLAAIFLVMLPSFVRYYGDSDVEFFSSLSAVTLLHAFVGAPAIITAVYYVFGVVPKNRKKWMRLTAGLWIASVAIGTFLFLQMLGLLPAVPSMPGM
jgi:MFS family permease